MFQSYTNPMQINFTNSMLLCKVTQSRCKLMPQSRCNIITLQNRCYLPKLHKPDANKFHKLDASISPSQSRCKSTPQTRCKHTIITISMQMQKPSCSRRPPGLVDDFKNVAGDVSWIHQQQSHI